MKPVALTIAGSDPSGGAGIQADLKTFHQLGVYGEAVITLLTVQNTTGVEAVELLDAGFVVRQAMAVIKDIPPNAAKTGALGNAAIASAVAVAAREFAFPLVVDPVMISKHGAALIEDQARKVLLEELFPVAAVVTPNLPEAEALTGMPIRNIEDMRAAAAALRKTGASAVLIKGGHLEGDAIDVLLDEAGYHEFTSPRLVTRHTHGTGCTYSAAITALLARGERLTAAVRRAKDFITEAIRSNPGLGHGGGPVNHHVDLL